MPAAGESPEIWLGQQVVVEMRDGSIQEVARLDGIGDWGVILAHPVLGGVFRPWNSFDAMWLAREEDLTGPPG